MEAFLKRGSIGGKCFYNVKFNKIRTTFQNLPLIKDLKKKHVHMEKNVIDEILIILWNLVISIVSEDEYKLITNKNSFHF